MKSLQELATEALLEQINPVYYSTFLKVSGLEERLVSLLQVVKTCLSSIRHTLDHRRTLDPLFSEYTRCDQCGNEEVPLGCDPILFDSTASVVLCKERDISRVRKRTRETEEAIRDFCDLLKPNKIKRNLNI